MIHFCHTHLTLQERRNEASTKSRPKDFLSVGSTSLPIQFEQSGFQPTFHSFSLKDSATRVLSPGLVWHPGSPPRIHLYEPAFHSVHFDARRPVINIQSILTLLHSSFRLAGHAACTQRTKHFEAARARERIRALSVLLFCHGQFAERRPRVAFNLCSALDSRHGRRSSCRRARGLFGSCGLETVKILHPLCMHPGSRSEYALWALWGVWGRMIIFSTCVVHQTFNRAQLSHCQADGTKTICMPVSDHGRSTSCSQDV
ncbi:hypothetical protein DFH06DRAFT_643063 [Mycena polygramma]|nr:hypothetical protein DFH06DRAFT_643063 [Mycena polygramma]